jgi:uncharacterized protein (TIGR02453 family)
VADTGREQQRLDYSRLMSQAYFGPPMFAFLRELKKNNTREWFAAEKDRYVRDVEAPMLQFIADFARPLAAISPRFVADPRRVGGSMFRIYRDTRFSHDKTPFKTWVSARFPHDSRKTSPSVPSFYLHLEPGDCAGGGGIYHPDPASLQRIRERIVAAPREWRGVLRGGLEVEGELLTRVPPGFNRSHPFAADLKRKDHYSIVAFTARAAASREFVDQYAAICERAAPLVRFIAAALGLRWK